MNTTDNNKIKVSITGTLHYDTSVKEINHYRINKTNYISIVTIPIETKYINSRTIDGSIGY